MRSPLSLLCSGLNKPKDLNFCSYILPPSPLAIFVSLLWMLSSRFMSLLYCSTQNCTQCCRWGCTAQSRVDHFSHWTVAVLGLMHPRVWLALMAARAHCWLLFNLLSTTIPTIAALHSLILLSAYISWVASSQVQNLALVKLHAQSSNLTTFLCSASHLSWEWAAPSNQVSSTNLAIHENIKENWL